MCALLGPSKYTGPQARRRTHPESLAILSLQRTPIPQSPPLKFGNIVGRAIIRLVGAILLEQSDEGAVQRARYITLETMAPLSNDPFLRLPAVAA
jgi:hypothetical protein